MAVGVVIVTPGTPSAGQLGERGDRRGVRADRPAPGLPLRRAGDHRDQLQPGGGGDQRLVEGPAARAVPSQRPAKRCALVGGHPAILPSARRSAQNVGLSDPPHSMGTVTDHLIVRGAREHNLRNVDITLPRDSLVVFTGLSGSGKSSLAFDTIFAEGQRRYVESLSSLRPAVPRPDGQAGRRLHRGSVARRSRSTRSRRPATRGRPSAPSPRSTTTCGCCTPGSVTRTARSAASRSPSRPRSRSSTGCWRCRRAPASRCWPR